jgi:hypothetical protein
MISFIDDEAEVSGEEMSDDPEKSDDIFELDRRQDNKNFIHPEDYLPKSKSRKNEEESKKCANLELPIYMDYIEKTVSQRKMWLPRDPFEPMRHIEVQENQHLVHSTDE